MKKAIACLSVLLALSQAHSQFLSDQTAEMDISHSYSTTLGAGVSYYDWNKDGWPDLSFCNRFTPPTFYVNNQGVFELIEPVIPNTAEMRSMLWVDIDNDGDADISVSSHYSTFRLYRNDDGVFNEITLQAGLITPTTWRTYGHSWADYDKDGYLDLYIANYHHLGIITNYLYRNNGDGTFTDVTTTAGVSNGVSMSFLGVWFDANSDNWPDLYVINDKFTPNALFLNNGDGTFTDVSNLSDAGIVMDAMTCTVGDYDNDGHMDIYMTNSVLSNKLLAGDGQGHFYDVTTGTNTEMYSLSWGAMFSDLDLDMDEDLYVCTGTSVISQSPDRFFLNTGDSSFNNAPEYFSQGNNNSYCAVEGDYDLDGDNDVTVLCALNSQSEFYRNDINEAPNSITIALEGVLCNRDAIGSRLDLYVEGVQQSRYTFCGESFLGQNAQYEIFGLGDAEFADSLVILWPDGFEEVFYSIPSGTFMDIVQGSSLTNALNAEPQYILCPGEIIELDAGEFATYLWSNGHTERYLTVTEPGIYSVQTTTSQGFTIESNQIEVIYSELPVVFEEFAHVSCFGADDGWIALAFENDETAYDVLWNNDSTNFILEGLQAGIYSVTVSNEAGCAIELNFEIFAPENPLSTELSMETVSCFGQADAWLEITAEGGTQPLTYYFNGVEFSGSASNLEAGTMELLVVDANGCSLSETVEITQPSSELQAELSLTHETFGNDGTAFATVSGGTPPYQYLWNGSSGLPGNAGFASGIHTLEIIDAQGCSLIVEFEIEDHTGIEEAQWTAVNVYPNPANNLLFVSCDFQVNPDHIELLGADGKLIQRYSELEGKHQTLDVSMLSEGIYFLKVISSNSHSLHRIVIRR